VEAVVKLRLRDCKRRLLIAAYQMEQAQQAITARLSSAPFVVGTTDPLSDLSLAMIEGEVELEVVEPWDIIALACLNLYGVFDPEMYIAVKYADPSGHGDGKSQIRLLRNSFPFTEVFQQMGPDRCAVSDSGRLFLSIYAKSQGALEAQYAIAPANPRGHPQGVPSPLTLPAGWGLS
jgi:hypothetical protein